MDIRKNNNILQQPVHQSHYNKSNIPQQSVQSNYKQSNISQHQVNQSNMPRQSNMCNIPSGSMAKNSVQQIKQSNTVIASNQRTLMQQSNAYNQSIQQSNMGVLINRKNNIHDSFPSASNIGKSLTNSSLPQNPFA